MSKKTAFLFPGQGAQYPGMGRDFFEKYSVAKAVFEEADQTLGFSFSKHIFEGPAEELTETKNSQLAIFITSIAILRVVEALNPHLKPSVCAGLSLGEYTALVAAGVLSFKDGLLLVQARGNYMQEACETHPGTMNVVLGMELEQVQEALKSIEGVWIANLNCPGQIVISGEKESIERAAAILKEKGARRVMPLDVSGAFHSGLMEDAKAKLEPMIHSCDMKKPESIVVMNVNGAEVSSLPEIQDQMIHQVTHPVLWQKGIEEMLKMGVELFIEMGPGKTLAGMNKRIGVTIPTISVEKVEDLQGVGYGSPVA